jgi:multiple sugar transport system ATP-binding protein
MPGWARFGEYVDHEVVLGIRPEEIEDAELHPECPPEFSAEAMIDVVEMMGSEAYLNASIGSLSLVARVEATTGARDGVPHRLAFNVAKGHLFDPTTTTVIR